MLIDDAAVLPNYERVVSIVQNSKLQGVAFKQTGSVVVFTYARVDE